MYVWTCSFGILSRWLSCWLTNTSSPKQITLKQATGAVLRPFRALSCGLSHATNWQLDHFAKTFIQIDIIDVDNFEVCSFLDILTICWHEAVRVAFNTIWEQFHKRFDALSLRLASLWEYSESIHVVLQRTHWSPHLPGKHSASGYYYILTYHDAI